MGLKPPTSTHYNLHVSISRVWSTLPLAAESNTDEVVPDGRASAKLVKELIWAGDEEATADFVTAVRMHICKEDGRGNIYQAGIDDHVRFLLPSFFAALTTARRKKIEDERERSRSKDTGMRGPSERAVGLDYVHDWTKNSLKDEIAYELSLRKEKAES